jgi:hypothetical protein
MFTPNPLYVSVVRAEFAFALITRARKICSYFIPVKDTILYYPSAIKDKSASLSPAQHDCNAAQFTCFASSATSLVLGVWDME